MLPRGGGSFDQPAGLMEEMRRVHDAVQQAEMQREQAKAKAAMRGGI